MSPLLYQTILPFLFSAIIVIIITVVAEKYGTKVGGILGTLPSTIVVAFVFIAINQDVFFASQSAAVVPAELGINLLFLFCFALFAKRSPLLAFIISFGVWGLSSYLLFVGNLTNIFVSWILYLSIFAIAFGLLEYKIKIPSIPKAVVHYTPQKILLRGILAGIIIAIAVMLSNINAVLSGIFSVFPAILSSTMFIFVREQGPQFAAGMAKSMMFGISSVAVYATVIHFLFPSIGVAFGSAVAYVCAFIVTMLLFSVRKKLK